MSNGRAMCAPARFNWVISARIASGQYSDNVANGTMMGPGADAVAGAVLIAEGETGCAGNAVAGAGGAIAGAGEAATESGNMVKRLFKGSTRLAGRGAATGAAGFRDAENGLVISSETSTDFLAGERANNFGFSRDSTSFSGTATASESYSVPT